MDTSKSSTRVRRYFRLTAAFVVASLATVVVSKGVLSPAIVRVAETAAHRTVCSALWAGYSADEILFHDPACYYQGAQAHD